MEFLGESSGIPGLPEPPSDSSSLPDNLNPSAILVGLAAALETLSLMVIFATSVAATLRPRTLVYYCLFKICSTDIKISRMFICPFCRSVHQPPKGAGKKKKKQDAPEEQSGRVNSPRTKRFDQVAVTITTKLLPQVQEAASKLNDLSQAWAKWCSENAARAFMVKAEQAAKAVFDENVEFTEVRLVLKLFYVVICSPLVKW